MYKHMQMYLTHNYSFYLFLIKTYVTVRIFKFIYTFFKEDLYKILKFLCFHKNIFMYLTIYTKIEIYVKCRVIK